MLPSTCLEDPSGSRRREDGLVIQNYKIDQARTFATLMLLGVSPKLAFGDNERQETSKA